MKGVETGYFSGDQAERRHACEWILSVAVGIQAHFRGAQDEAGRATIRSRLVDGRETIHCRIEGAFHTVDVVLSVGGDYALEAAGHAPRASARGGTPTATDALHIAACIALSLGCEPVLEL